MKVTRASPNEIFAEQAKATKYAELSGLSESTLSYPQKIGFVRTLSALRNANQNRSARLGVELRSARFDWICTSERRVIFPFGASPGLTIGQDPRSNSTSAHEIGRVENFVSDLRPQRVAESSGLSESTLSYPQNFGSVRTLSEPETRTTSDPWNRTGEDSKGKLDPQKVRKYL